jgi:hypothetical protein
MDPWWSNITKEWIGNQNHTPELMKTGVSNIDMLVVQHYDTLLVSSWITTGTVVKCHLSTCGLSFHSNSAFVSRDGQS